MTRKPLDDLPSSGSRFAHLNTPAGRAALRSWQASRAEQEVNRPVAATAAAIIAAGEKRRAER
jgi:hypothetical protein